MGFILIIIIFLTSLHAFEDRVFFHRYKFEVDRVLIGKEFQRLVTSGFLHVGWVHLLLNLFTLYAFYGPVESQLGATKFLVIYFASLTGGDLFALFVHRHHGDYSSVGASGAICGIIFAAIALFPGMEIGFFGLPFSIPSGLYGLLFVLYSIYGIKTQRGNIGHEAHLGGALIGMLVALFMQPEAFTENYSTILLIAIPTIAFITLTLVQPRLLLLNGFSLRKRKKVYSIDQQYNAQRMVTQAEIDVILDKISRSGMDSLTDKERAKLKQQAKAIK